jgi:hypothetical protein
VLPNSSEHPLPLAMPATDADEVSKYSCQPKLHSSSAPKYCAAPSGVCGHTLIGKAQKAYAK